MTIPKLELDEREAETAAYVAMAIRNALEGFHADHLSDAQMAELNPLLRNAVATALYALAHREEDPRCAAYVTFQRMLVPDYWERAEPASTQAYSWRWQNQRRCPDHHSPMQSRYARPCASPCARASSYISRGRAP